MAIPVARVHLKMAHAALPALLPTPPMWKMLRVLPTPCVATILPKPPLAKPGRADADERWDARKTKPTSSASSPPAKPGRADSGERWDVHKKAASPAWSPSSSGTSSLATSSSKWATSRAPSAEHWDVHKKRCPPQAELLDDDENSSVGSDDIDAEEEEIVWKPRAMYAGQGFVVAAPQASMIPMPTSFLVPVA